MAKLEVEGLYKVFGRRSAEALERARQGEPKDEIRRATRSKFGHPARVAAERGGRDLR